MRAIPDKLYFKIGEVSEIVGVKPYVLRYWETEFKEIVPVKSRTNQRMYRRKDVDLILKIRDLLHHQRFTINGAKKKLKGEGARGNGKSSQLGLEFESSSASVPPALKKELAGLLEEMRQSLRE